MFLLHVLVFSCVFGVFMKHNTWPKTKAVPQIQDYENANPDLRVEEAATCCNKQIWTYGLWARRCLQKNLPSHGRARNRNQLEPARTSRSQPETARTSRNQPEPARTNQNQPEPTGTNRNQPEPTGTNQNQAEPTRTN